MADSSKTVLNDLKARVRPKRPSADAVRDSILKAATLEFSRHGFQGASTRAIAKGANVSQSQVLYHYNSKYILWQTCVNEQMEGLEQEIISGIDLTSPIAALKGIIHGMTRFAASNPALQRMMFNEGHYETERLTWLVETHFRPRYIILVQLWNEVAKTGRSASIQPETFNYVLLGLTSLLFVSATEIKLLADIDVTNETYVAQHIEDIIAMLLPGDPTP